MSLQKKMETYSKAYALAIAADEAFSKHLIRQFKKCAGDARYASKAKFDAATMAASAKKLKADETLRKALLRMRAADLK